MKPVKIRAFAVCNECIAAEVNGESRPAPDLLGPYEYLRVLRPVNGTVVCPNCKECSPGSHCEVWFSAPKSVRVSIEVHRLHTLRVRAEDLSTAIRVASSIPNRPNGFHSISIDGRVRAYVKGPYDVLWV